MKRFLSAVVFCLFLLLAVSSSFLLPSSEAQNNVLQNLLDLPAPPPPNPLFIGRTSSNRALEFYNKKNQPQDDAPIDELLDYWRAQSGNYQELGYNIKPSAKTLERILTEIQEKPELLTGFLNALPRTEEVVEFVKKLYDDKTDGEETEESWKESVKYWLTYNSKYFSSDLVQAANQVSDTEQYVTNQEELLALVRVDWEKARPLVEALYNNKGKPVSGVLARWAFYIHALETDASIDADKYRDELKAIVEDKTASNGMRDLALDALVKEKDWNGRDDWYFTLLEDETLAELEVDGRLFTGLTTIIYHSPPEKFLEKMLELLRSDNKTVRSAVVRNLGLLLKDGNPEVVRALLPWLENPNWAKEYNTERQALVNALGKIKLPESVPGLVAVLNEKVKIAPMINSNSNMMNSSNSMTMSNSSNSMKPMNSYGGNMMSSANSANFVSYPFRYEAIEALATQRDVRAVPALRRLLPEVEEWQRTNVVKAMLLSGGFSVPEQIEALEAVAAYSMNSSNVMMNSSNTVMLANTNSKGYYDSSMSNVARPFEASDIKQILGYQLTNMPEPDDGLVKGLVVRIAELDKKDARLADILRRIIRNWHGAAVNSLLLSDLKNGKTDTDSIIKLLSLRKHLREKQSDEVYAVRGGNQIADGIAACILENENDYEGILTGEAIETKTAMLGCARLIRARLPIERVAPLLKHQNKLLALAAERWLVSEDSFEARQIVLANHPNEALILGARTDFTPTESSERSQFLAPLFASVGNLTEISYFYYFYPAGYRAIEKKLQKEVTETADLLGIYSFERNFIRIYKDRVVLSWDEDESRYRERVLTAEEFDELKNYLASQNVDSLKPFLSFCYDCYEKELLMLGKQGGRRVFVKSDRTPPFFAKLDTIFSDLRKKPARLRYYLEKDVAGLEILYADDNLRAQTVWKTGDDFRLLIEDIPRRAQIEKELEEQYEQEASREETDYEKVEVENTKRRQQREFEHLSWQKFAGGNLAGFANQPPQMDFIPVRDNFAVRANVEQWKARTANFEIREGNEGLFKISGGQATKIADGYYTNPVVTADGRWVIVSKYDEEEGSGLVRINLATRKQFKISTEQYPQVNAIAFIPSVNKILVDTNIDYDGERTTNGAYYLLEAETGTMQSVKGDLGPLAQQISRALQPTGKVDEFWAAIPDRETAETQIGTYNAKTFTFKPLLKIPQIKFDSMQMWVDAGKVYFVYGGHLLALRLPK